MLLGAAFPAPSALFTQRREGGAFSQKYISSILVSQGSLRRESAGATLAQNRSRECQGGSRKAVTAVSWPAQIGAADWTISYRE
jgi:hypothetical protein